MLSTKNTFIFLKILFIFKERGREGEREKVKHQCVVSSHTPPTGEPSLQPRHVSWLGIEPVTLWFAAGTQSTEPYQPGPKNGFKLSTPQCLMNYHLILISQIVLNLLLFIDLSQENIVNFWSSLCHLALKID